MPGTTDRKDKKKKKNMVKMCEKRKNSIEKTKKKTDKTIKQSTIMHTRDMTAMCLVRFAIFVLLF